MNPFLKIQSPAISFLRDHIDTDQIIPSRFMKTLTRSGLGRHLFHDLRYTPDGTPDPACILNRSDRQAAQIMIAGENFGCGSSREHAVWALADFGIRCVIAPSFGDIFGSNCSKNGLLLIRLPSEMCLSLNALALVPDHEPFTVDLEAQIIIDPERTVHPFAIEASERRSLIDGRDQIARTMAYETAIAHHEMDAQTLAAES